MVKLKIINISNYDYELEDMKENKYTLNLEFLDIEEKPKVGDYISISEELLNPRYEEYSTNYTFGNLDSEFGREKLLPIDIDVIKLEMDSKEILLKRLYG